jgi:hypothetical protein
LSTPVSKVTDCNPAFLKYPAIRRADLPICQYTSPRNNTDSRSTESVSISLAFKHGGQVRKKGGAVVNCGLVAAAVKQGAVERQIEKTRKLVGLLLVEGHAANKGVVHTRGPVAGPEEVRNK